jgi:hypothetical protein
LPLDRRNPLLAVFPEQGEGLVSARFFKYMLLDPVRDTASRTVILRYESGAPALVEGDVGRGKVMVLTTTVDRDWTDLPIRTGFLPLVRESVRHLVGAGDDDSPATLLVGEPRLLSFSGDAQTLEVTRPDGSVWMAKREQGKGPRSLAYDGTDQIGLYRVRAAGPDGVFVAQTAQDFAVNLDPRESDPAQLAPDKRPDRIAVASAGAKPPKHRVELWHELSAILILIVLGESLLSVRWRRARAADETRLDSPAT